VTTNGNYKYVGRLDVSFDAAGAATVDGGGPKRVVVDTGAGVPADAVVPDPGLVNEVQTPVEECLDELAATPVAETEVLFDRSRSGVRSSQANTGNLVSDAWLDSYDRYAGNVGLPDRDVTVVAIQNGGGIRQNGGDFLPSDGSPGVISRLDVINTLPFDNTMAVVQNVTPTDLKQIFERAGSGLPGEGGQFLQVAGLAVTYDPSQQAQVIETDGTVTTPGSRVVSIQLTDGTPIVTAGSVVAGAPEVTIVTNNFTAGGGDNYPWLADNPNKTTLRNADGLAIPYEQALREYLEDFQLVPASDTRYEPFPTGETRITVLP
jgi:5'-nucleotidase